MGVWFRKPERADHVVFFDPVQVGITLGSTSAGLANMLSFRGNPLAGSLSKTYARAASIGEFGCRARGFEYYAVALEEDADTIAAGLLDDVAYPDPCGSIVFFHGNAAIGLGDLVELRDVPLRRLERELDGEWGGRFAGTLVGRVCEVTHRLSGNRVSTRLRLTSPLRSVSAPLGFMVRSQPGEHVLYQFRLDDGAVGLDMGYHLD